MGAPEKLRILVIDGCHRRARALTGGLADAGFTSVVIELESADLEGRIGAIDPDIVLIDLENPSRDVVDQLFRVTERVKRPVAMFVDSSDQDTAMRAIRAGVSAYVVGGVSEDRVQSIVEIAIARYSHMRALTERAETAEAALSERKRIERAKGVLMRRRNCDEQAAYAQLRDAARRQNKTIAQMADVVIEADAIGV